MGFDEPAWKTIAWLAGCAASIVLTLWLLGVPL